MNARAIAFFAAVELATVALLVGADWSALGGLTATDLLGWASLVGLAIVSDLFSIKFKVGDRPAESSIAFVPILAIAVLFPIAATLAASVLAFGTSESFIRKRQPSKGLFNVCLLTVSIGVGAVVYGIPSTEAQPLAAVIPRFIGLAGALFLTNQVLASVAFALISEMPVGEAAKKVFGATGANLLYDFLVSPIALITAVLYWELSWFGILLVILPLLLIRYSYISKSQLEHANRALLNVLIKTIETRDPYTSGHSIRVSTLAVIIAEEMKIPSREVEDVRTAALLHDIGKIDPAFAQIIRKPGVLTDEEYEIIRAHAATGAELLRDLTNLPEEIIRGVRNHHERYDGTGYPDKIKGLEIPLSSRIIMMCDSLDAMLSDRPYRKALSQDAVRAELDRCSGTQFDPEIVASVIRGNVIAKAAELVPKLTPEEAAMAGF